SKYENFGISKSSMFVAHNTVYVESKVFPPPSMNKAYILFFGSLTPRKGIPLLIDAFVKAYQHFSRKEIKLLIVGDGPERNFLENIINSDSLHRLVELRHGVYSFQDKIDVFSKAVATVSPQQAGLSVLESFAFGVPFITNVHAITGGEIFNIEEGATGFLFQDKEQLIRILVRLVNDGNLQERLASNCFNYYWDNRTISQMAKGFASAVYGEHLTV